MSYQKILNEFNTEHMPDLHTVVLGALELFSEDIVLPNTNSPFRRPLVIGSGNAEATGRILFTKNDAVFANESDYKSIFNKTENIDGIFLISASGGKHSVEIAAWAKDKNLPIILLTNNPESDAAKQLSLDEVFVFPKNREPYTYNTSTYLSMILADTNESVSAIQRLIKETSESITAEQLAKYSAYSFILPADFSEIKPMLRTKFDELFGSHICGRFFSPEELKHAKTVVPNDNELFINIGNDITWLDIQNLINIDIADDINFGGVLSLTYYLVGLIQSTKPPYFKENIVQYCKEMSEVFNQEIKPIVE